MASQIAPIGSANRDRLEALVERTRERGGLRDPRRAQVALRTAATPGSHTSYVREHEASDRNAERSPACRKCCGPP
jgi:hypothetical protein